MARYLKCKLKSCGKMHDFVDKGNLIKREIGLKNGKTRNLYYCAECYDIALREEAFLTEEGMKKDDLNDVVKSIYGVGDGFNLPSRWWEFIQDLRNGTNRYEKLWKRRYKKGIPYEVITEAYRMSKDSIQWAKLNKKFRTIEQELRYGLAIMSGKLIDADRKIKRSAIQEKASMAMEDSRIDFMEDNREVVFKNSQDEDDISFLLGDDD